MHIFYYTVLTLSVFHIMTTCSRLLGAQAQCTADLYFLVPWSLVVSPEFWLSKMKIHWEGTEYSPQESPVLPIWSPIPGNGGELASSSHLGRAAWSKHLALPFVWFITCNSFFISLSYIFLPFVVNLLYFLILIGLFFFPSPQKGDRRVKGASPQLFSLSYLKPGQIWRREQSTLRNS